MKFLLIVSLFLLSGCITPPAKGLPFKYNNDCLPQAIVMAQALKEKNIESDVLIITTQKWKHALCKYLYPKTKNTLWCWDAEWKSLKLRAWASDPSSVAKAWMKITNHSEELVNAEFLN